MTVISGRKKQTNESHTKEPTFMKMEVYGKRSQENGPNAKAEKDKIERATGLGRRTTEDI